MNREANTGVFPPQEENSGFESIEGQTPPAENNEGSNSVEPVNAAQVNAEQVNAEQANAGEVNAEQANAGEVNTANAVSVPATALTGVKRTFKEEQAEEFAKLKAAIEAQGTGIKAKAPDAAKLASARLKGNPSYQRMFENATAGKKISELYQNNATAKRRAKINAKKAASAIVTNNTVGKNIAALTNSSIGSKTAKKRRGKAATVTNSTVGNNNSALLKTAKPSRTKTKNTGFSTQTNLRGINLPNTGAMNAKVDSIVSMASAISAQVKELMTLAKTLKSGRAAPKNTTRKPRASKKASKTAVAANSLLGAVPLPIPGNTTVGPENAPLENSLGFGALSAIPEANEGQLNENNSNGNYTPPQ
jgi:hypothetical protein